MRYIIKSIVLALDFVQFICREAVLAAEPKVLICETEVEPRQRMRMN